MYNPTYRAQFTTKLIEVDDYEQGVTDHVQEIPFDLEFTSDTLESLLEQIKNGLGDGLAAWSDDPGRLDVQTFEDEFGLEPSETQKAEWKAGKLKLYACTYYATVSKLEPVTAEAIAKATSKFEMPAEVI